MSEKNKLTVQKREISGKKVKRLRALGFVPANIYGSKIESIAIQVKLEDLKKAYKEAGETSIIDISIEGEKTTRPVLIAKLQVSPLKKQILHVDLRQVDLKEKITADVPLVLINESPAESLGALIIKLKDVVSVEALPMDIPEKITVDISKLNQVGDSLTVADLSAEAKVTILDQPDSILVKADAKSQGEEPQQAQETAEQEASEEKKSE